MAIRIIIIVNDGMNDDVEVYVGRMKIKERCFVFERLCKLKVSISKF